MNWFRRHPLLTLVGVFVALVYLLWHPRTLNHDGFAKVRNGMTQAEVEELLGGPPGAYYPAYPGGGGGMSKEWGGCTLDEPVEPGIEMLWNDDRNRYEVTFNDQGRVIRKWKRIHWSASAHSCRPVAFIWTLGERGPTPYPPR